MLEKLRNKVEDKRIAKTDFLSEIKRCKSDPAFFAKNYIYIKHKDKGAIKFKLWDFQEKVLKDFQSNRLNIILKSRQLGITELMSMYILWFALFQKDKNVVIVSKNRKAASNIVKRIKYAYKKLPSWLKIAKMVSDNVHTIEFDNDSVIFADATTENAGRGEACSLFVVDEGAFIPALEEMWASVFPTIDNGGSCIISSTPNGASGQFYELYSQAPANGFNPIWLDWNCHPERDQEWFEKTKKSMNAKKFAQEFLGNFLLSGDTVIDGEDISRHEKRTQEPMMRFGIERDIWVWKQFNDSHRYCIGADTARGDGEDFSAFHVIDVDEKEVVCEYKGKIKVDKFAELLTKVGNMYGSCTIAIENNGYGLAVLMKLIELKYPNIYSEVKSTKQPTEGFVDYENDDDIVMGFTTNLQSRILAIDKMEESIRLDLVSIYSPRLIHELRNFIFENGKPKARKGSNDDLVMSLAIGLYVSSFLFPNANIDSSMKKKMLENIIVMQSKLSLKTVGEQGFNKDLNAFETVQLDPYTIQFKDKVLDFRFLLGNKVEQPSKQENKGIDFLGFLK